MKYLLDVNLLLAVIWENHSRHAEAFAWVEDKSILLCPLAELGFLRISTNKKAMNAPMEKARELSHGNSEAIGSIGYAGAMTGDKAKARGVL